MDSRFIGDRESKLNLSISSKERRKLFDNLRKLSFNDASADTAPNELFPYGLISRQPRDRQYDRETALIAATGVEQGLECAIAAHLCRREDASKLLFADEGVLRDFNAKIKMAYIIGVVGKKTAADIQAIRGVRNAFAHARAVIYFETPEVKAVCNLITLPQREPMTMGGIEFNDARERFIQSCFRLHLHLLCYQPDREAHNPSLLD